MDYSDSFSHLLAAYDSFFEPFVVLGSALFGAALFVFLRKIRFIQTNDVDLEKIRRSIFLSGACGIALILISYLSDARLLAFHFYMSENGPQKSGFAYQHFMQEYQKVIVIYQVLAIVVALVGVISAIFSLDRSRDLPDTNERR